MRSIPEFYSKKEKMTFGDAMMSFIAKNPPAKMNASLRKLLQSMQALNAPTYSKIFLSILEELEENKSGEKANELFKEHIEPILLSHVPQHSHGSQWDYFTSLCEAGGVSPFEYYQKKYPPKNALRKKKKGKKKGKKK